MVISWLAAGVVSAAPLTSATVTETKNVVQYRPATAEERAAKLGDVLNGADVLRTGERSLAELEFDDKTITRLGSKSVFTFEPTNREFRLEKGLALICMPKGSGGRIVTSAITAAIEGTTVLVLGIGRIIFLEGFAVVFTADGKQSKPIVAGQIALMENGQLQVYDIMIDPLLKSVIITSRANPLPTWDAILEVDRQQRDDIAKGKKVVKGAPDAAPGTPDITDPAYRDEGIFGNVLHRVQEPGLVDQ